MKKLKKKEAPIPPVLHDIFSSCVNKGAGLYEWNKVVEFSLHMSDEKTVELDHIAAKEKGVGHGTKFMNVLKATLDFHRKDLKVIVMPDDPKDIQRTFSFYERNGLKRRTRDSFDMYLHFAVPTSE